MENSRMYGLEFPPLIEFTNYEGGVKLIKRLHIKNTTKYIIRFRFLYQSSTYFTYPLQDIENISPGLNKSYVISFLNPLHDNQTINETLNIVIVDDKYKNEKIPIKIIATPIKSDVVVPSTINFNEMVIKQKNKKEILLKNDGQLNGLVKLSYKNMLKDKEIKIKFEPSNFILKSKEKQIVNVIIYSKVPQKYESIITCSIIEIPKRVEKKINYELEKKVTFESEIKKNNLQTTINPYETKKKTENEENFVSKIIKILNKENIQVCLIKKQINAHMIFVLPHIIILCDQNKEIFNKDIINFGNITLGQKITKTFFLKNLTNAPINVVAKKQKGNSVFTFPIDKLTLKEKSTEAVSINVNGNNPVSNYTEVIRFKACNDYSIELFLLCEIKNIKLVLQKTLYIFENTKIGDTINEKIVIRNDEDTDLDVEIINSGYFFYIKNKKFIIKKNSFHSIYLVCNCIYPINVYKRIYFLVHLNKKIFYIDVICNFSISYKMPPLSIHHIYRYKNLIHDKNIVYNSYYEKNEYIDIWDFPVEFDSYEDTTYELLNDILEISEKDVFAVPKELEVQEMEEKDLMLINKTPVEYTCVWLNAVDKQEQGTFEVTPKEAPLLPFGYQKFRVKNIKGLKKKYVCEVYECIVFPSNNKDYTKCNSKTLLAPFFIYATFFQFNTKYICETENVQDSLVFYPKNISFLNIIEEEYSYAIVKFENNSEVTQIIDFTPYKNEAESIKVYPQINYVPKKSFLNVIIFYSPKKKQSNNSEIKIYYLVNGIEKNYISVLVSHEMNNVMLNAGDTNINLPCVGTETESYKKVNIENLTERNVLCVLIKEDVEKLVNIDIDGNNDPVDNKKETNLNELNNTTVDNENIKHSSSFIDDDEKLYNFYFFCLSPFEKKNIHISAICNFSITKSIPLLFNYLLYINDADMENKFIYLKKNMNDHIKSSNKFSININIVKSSLMVYPKLIESELILPGKQFNAKITVKNKHPVIINFKTKTKIVQIDGIDVFDEKEVIEAEENIISNNNEYVINPFSEKNIIVSFNTSRKGVFLYRFFVMIAEYRHTVDIILKVVMPYFQVIDINDFKTPTSIYWNMTSIDKINACLKDHLSKTELDYKKEQSVENLQNLFNRFNYIEFNIGNNILNEQTYVNLLLYNPLDISLNIQINTIKYYIFPILPPYIKNEEEKMAQFLYVDNTFRHYMRCLDSFDIYPKKFEIKKKTAKTITLIYKHKYVGFHNMPLIVEVENGKIVPLNVCSLTLYPNMPPINWMNTKNFNQHILTLKNECIINVDLLNDSELDIFYEMQHNENFTILNPKGIIKRRKYISLFILISRLSPSIMKENLILNSYFKHLQKDIMLNKIQLEVNINSTPFNIYQNMYKKINIFNNKFYNHMDEQNINTFCSNFIPPYPYIYAKNKLFFITPSSINILYVPTNTIIERIVIIKNYSYLKDLKFKISNKNTLPGNVLKIYPQNGIVKKREHVLLTFTFILTDILLDIEGNIQIELKFIENDYTTTSTLENIQKNTDDLYEEEIEEVYEDTREEGVGANVLSTQKKKKKIDDLTFSHAQKIFDNIQTFKYTYDNISRSTLQKAIRRLYGIPNDDDIVEKENVKETNIERVKQFSKFYFYVHIKIYTCNSKDVVMKSEKFENLTETNIYPKHLYFKRYIYLPIPMEDKSKSFFKRHYFDFDKLENLKIQNKMENEIPDEQTILYHKRKIYCCMFSEMFKSIIKTHIKKYVTELLNISSCSIQTIDKILSEDLIDVIKRNKKADVVNSPIEHNYSFLKPTILSHFFSSIFSDVIKNLTNENVVFTKKA
ncbi:conserved protein, unknown function [Hepatocystis sp. ex Piliocolobus tephrosceles]|nr:conserved protein, unknown function [Hepatocystis sp. ex Piliocolobus tephrosceles]